MNAGASYDTGRSERDPCFAALRFGKPLETGHRSRGASMRHAQVKPVRASGDVSAAVPRGQHSVSDRAAPLVMLHLALSGRMSEGVDLVYGCSRKQREWA